MSSGWTNDTYRYLAEHLGEQKCREMKDQEFPQIPEPGFFSGIRLWTSSKLLNAAIQLAAYRKRQRPTHTLGVGGLGIATIVDNVNLPKNSFFTSGRIFPVRIRHANLTFDDDRTLDVRSASLKFSDHDLETPLDLIMNSGDRCPFWNGPTVSDFQKSRKGPKELEEWMLKNSAYYYNAVQSMRRAPTSYSDMSYYSQVTMELKEDVDPSKIHYVRFRLIPSDRTKPESGLPDAVDQKTPWNYPARSGDTRPADYLKQEYTKKLEDGSVNFVLQIQLCDTTANDQHDIFNMGKVWKNSLWRDLAKVTIFCPLSPNVIERTCYNISHLPDCMALPEAKSYYDYRSIGHLRREVYAASQRGRLWSGPPVIEGPEKVEYKVNVKTSNEGGGGYEGEVHVTVSGNKGRTSPMLLDKSRIFAEDFSAGDRDAFTVQGVDVGSIALIQIDLSNTKHDGWNVDMITVEKGGQTETFPVYQWIYDQLVVRSGQATLPFQDNDELTAVRSLEKQRWRDQLPWFRWDSMPSHANIFEHKKLPRELQFMDEKNKDFLEGRKEGLTNLLLDKFIGIFTDVDSFHDFTSFFHVGVGEVPAVAQRWQSDREFGRQYLQGTHPTVISRITKLPEKFPVKEEDVKNVLGRGVTLQEELEAGHVYFVDFKELKGIKTAEGRFVSPAMGLFYVDGAGFIVPMAIQLYQEPGPQNPIFTPSDNEADWLCAKFYLKCADAQLHQMRDHLLLTHLIMEPFAVSLYRNVARVHPIFKLLVPHIRYTMAINTIGRITLIGADGLADKGLAVGKGGHIDLIKKAYLAFDYEDRVLPKCMDKRGVSDVAALPHYYYRDDSQAIWKVMQQFVEDIVQNYYHSDDDIKRDEEIQLWIKEVHDFGLPQHRLEGEVDHHVPFEFKTIADLVEVLTVIMFTCSCEHAAQNFGQFDYYSFNPNAPMIMRRAPPKEKGKLNVDDLVKMLGNRDNVAIQIAATWTLSKFSDDELFLGEYPHKHFQDKEAIDAISKFRERLSDVEAKIDTRNSEVEVPYIYLKPSRVPNSIAI